MLGTQGSTYLATAPCILQCFTNGPAVVASAYCIPAVRPDSSLTVGWSAPGKTSIPSLPNEDRPLTW